MSPFDSSGILHGRTGVYFLLTLILKKKTQLFSNAYEALILSAKHRNAFAAFFSWFCNSHCLLFLVIVCFLLRGFSFYSRNFQPAAGHVPTITTSFGKPPLPVWFHFMKTWIFCPSSKLTDGILKNAKMGSVSWAGNRILEIILSYLLAFPS